MIYEVTVSQFMPFLEPVPDSNIEGGIINQFFHITETIKVSRKRANILQRFNLGQTIIKRTTIKNVQVAHYLSMSGRASHGPSRTITQIFPMWQRARPVKYQIITQNIRIIQSVAAYRFRGIYQSMVLNQIITTQIKRHKTFTQTFHMLISVSAYNTGQSPSVVAHPYTLGGPNGTPSYEF